MLIEVNSMRGSDSGRSRILLTILLITILLALEPHVESTVQSADAVQCSVQLVSGCTFEATLANSQQPGTFRLQHANFSSPFEFPSEAISTLRFSRAEKIDAPMGPFCIELVGGAVFFGEMIGLSDSELTISTKLFGQKVIDRQHVERISRGSGGQSVVFIGPNGTHGWRMHPVDRIWTEDNGFISTDLTGSRVSADVGLPDKAKIELELSWRKKADFVLGLGIHPELNFHPFDFRLETWGRELILYRETDKLADLAAIQEVGDGAGRIRLHLFLDQRSGRLIALDAFGKKLAEIKATLERPEVFPGIRLVNKRGDVCLERLRISHWNGTDSQVSVQHQITLNRKEPTDFKGRLGTMNPQTKSLSVFTDDKETSIPLNDLADVSLAPKANVVNTGMVAICSDGTRLAGSLERVEDGVIFLKMESIRDPVLVSATHIRSLLFAGLAQTSEETKKGDDVQSARLGSLEMNKLKMRGTLTNSERELNSSCLFWNPVGSKRGSSIQLGASGRIVYQETPADSSTVLEGAIQRVPAANNVNQLNRLVPLQTLGAMSRRTTPIRPQPKQIHLRSGDVISFESIRVEESGVAIQSKDVEANLISNELIKLAELGFGIPSPTLTRVKRDRLLTVPRIQKDNPPTHLIQFLSGDFLRGRLLSLNEKKLEFEVRLEKMQIPIERVSRLWWLHLSEVNEILDDTESAPPVAQNNNAVKTDKLRIQAIRDDAIRLTLWGEVCDGDSVSGRSDVLGKCRFSLAKVTAVLFGNEIDRNVAQLAAQQWRLRGAVEPISASGNSSNGSEGRKPGVDSHLVGKSAPNFRLPRWNGGAVDLAELKGQVTILDFWASWCGPCLKSMPALERLSSEFKDTGVRLVAVNQEEAPETIRAAVERHKYGMPIAMDLDGKVGLQYSVSSLPQSVIIDREGKVARVFVGMSRDFEQQVRSALEELTGRE